DHADVAARGAQLGPVEGGDVRAVHLDAPGGGLLQPGQAADQGRLPGAGATDDAVHTAGLEMQIDAVERDDGVSAAGSGEDLREAVESDPQAIQAPHAAVPKHWFIRRNKPHRPAGPHVDGVTPRRLTSVTGEP